MNKGKSMGDLVMGNIPRKYMGFDEAFGLVKRLKNVARKEWLEGEYIFSENIDPHLGDEYWELMFMERDGVASIFPLDSEDLFADDWHVVDSNILPVGGTAI